MSVKRFKKGDAVTAKPVENPQWLDSQSGIVTLVLQDNADWDYIITFNSRQDLNIPMLDSDLQ
jgi:hypothetical protein